MIMSDALNKFDLTRLRSSNTLQVERPWSDAEVDWWRDRMFNDHGFYPEDLGELLSASASEPKLVTISGIDLPKESFVIKGKSLSEKPSCSKPKPSGTAPSTWMTRRQLPYSGPMWDDRYDDG